MESVLELLTVITQNKRINRRPDILILTLNKFDNRKGLYTCESKCLVIGNQTLSREQIFLQMFNLL